MKHDSWTTLKLLGWFFLSMIFGLVATIYVHNNDYRPDMPLWTAVIAVLIGLGVGIVFWYFVMRYIKAQLLVPFALSVGYFFAKTSMLILGITSVLAIVLIAICGAMSYVLIVKMMQKSWIWTRRLMPVSNLLMIGMMGWIGATVGAYTPPLAALIILVALSCYDAYAVWHSEHMQSWAKEFLKQRILPGLAVAKTKKEEFALLGGGDVFCIIFVASSFWKTSHAVAIASFVGMSAAIVLLFLMSKKGKFYPALPFILAGEIIVLLASWIWTLV